MNQLEVLRESLGQCDEIILDALLMRNRIVEDIMVYKEANNVPILQPEQEAKQKEWLERRMQEKRHKNEVADVFESITRNSKKIQARKLFNYNIVLIGFMGAGKSTISDYLKTVFAMDIIEMDQIIAERAGMSISDIFETYGEQYFRDCETNLLIEMQSRTNVVISCGGGTPMRECNVAEMKKNGRVVLLTAKPETILDRVKDSHDRPLIENNKTVPFIADLMSKRREKYEAAADIIIETDGKSELEICEELIHSLRQMDELREELIAEQREDLSFIWDAVQALPVQYREVIHLFYREGYSTREISQILGRKEATIRSDLSRGRGKLKELLKEAYDFEV